MLTGKANPSGHLTMTWPIAAADHPSTKNFPQEYDMYTYKSMQDWGSAIPLVDYVNHEEDIYVGYRYFDTFERTVAYPFGFGLSYTTFKFGQPKVKLQNSVVNIEVTVTNTGSVSGKEVAQVYVQAPKGNIEKPTKELKAFAKTRELQPGESQTLKMQVAVRDLTSFDEAHSQWIAEAGKYVFHIGNNVSNTDCAADIVLKEYTEQVNNVMAPQHELNLLRQ